MNADNKILFTTIIDESGFKEGVDSMVKSVEAAVKEIVVSIDKVNESINSISNALDSTKENDFFAIDSISDAVGIFGTTLSIVEILSTTLGTAGTAATGFGTAVTSVIGPIGLAIAAIGTVTSVISFLSSVFKEEKSDIELSTEATEKAIEQYQKLIEKGNELAKTASSESAYYENLKNELDAIVEKNGEVKAGYEDRALFITTKLSESTGKEISLIDGVIQGYEKLSPEIDKLIEKKRAKAILDAHEADYNNAVISQKNALEELQAAQKALTDEQEKKNSFVKDYIELSRSMGISEVSAAESAKTAWNNNLKVFEEDIRKKKDNYQTYTDTIRNNELAYSDFLKGNYENIEDTVSGHYEVMDEKESENFAKSKEKYQEKVDDELTALASLTEKKGILSEEQYNIEKNRHLAEIAANEQKLFELNNQMYIGADWYGASAAYLAEQGALAFDENGKLSEVARKHLEELHIEMFDSIPDYQAVLKDLADAGVIVFTENGDITQVAQNKLVAAFTKVGELAPEYSSLLSNMAIIGEEVFDGEGNLTTAAQTKLIDLFAEMQNLSPEYKDKLLDMAKNGEDVFSNTGQLTTAAKEKIAGAVKATEDNGGTFSASLKKIAKEGSDEIDKADTYSAGRNFILGASKGVNDNTLGFVQTVAQSCLSAVWTVKKTWDENSPSRVTEGLAKYFVDGLTVGTNKKKKEFLDSVEEISVGAVESVDGMAVGINGKLDSVKFNRFYDKFKDVDFMIVDEAILSEQLRMSSVVQTQSKIEMLKMNILKAENQTIQGKLDAVIENHVDLDGRELAVALAPMISEELAFNWR